MTSTIIARANTGCARMRRSTIGASLLSVWRTNPIETMTLAATDRYRLAVRELVWRPEDPEAFRPSSDGQAVPGNQDLSETDRRQRLACLFPNVEVPVDAPGDFYELYLSRGVLLEAGLIGAGLAGLFTALKLVERETGRRLMAALSQFKNTHDINLLRTIAFHADAPVTLSSA